MTRVSRRWIAAVVVTALLHLGTLGLYHVCAHAGESRTDGCVTCRVVGTSTTLASASPRATQPLILRHTPVARATECSAQPFIAPPGSRGPPPLA